MIRTVPPEGQMPDPSFKATSGDAGVGGRKAGLFRVLAASLLITIDLVPLADSV